MLLAEDLDTKIRKYWIEGNSSESVIRNLTEMHKAICACIKELEPQSGGRVRKELTLQEYLAQREGVSP